MLTGFVKSFLMCTTKAVNTVKLIYKEEKDNG